MESCDGNINSVDVERTPLVMNPHHSKLIGQSATLYRCIVIDNGKGLLSLAAEGTDRDKCFGPY